MTAPMIGITTRSAEHPTHGWPMIAAPRAYSQAVLRAGAIPLLVPLNLPADLLPALLSQLDGIIFSGGGDIETTRFNGQPHKKVYGVDRERDAIEFGLVDQAIQARLPFLGICRGFQVINVALGGTLYTHISDQLENALDHNLNPALPTDHPAHPVKLKPGSPLAEIFSSETITVNSLHHQGAKDIAPRLEVIGAAPDGLAEAVTLPGHPFGIGVQWHPECMPDDVRMQKLFAAFAQAAAGHHTRRMEHA